MKSLGYLLIAGGFLYGALVAVQTSENVVDWTHYVPALIVAAIGVALARMGLHGETRHEDKVTDDVQKLTGAIDRIVENITRLEAEKESIDTYDVHLRLDEIFPDDLSVFVEGRESIAHVYSLQAYADVMNEFAAA